MADPAVSSSPRSQGSSRAQRRARAASSDDALRPARVTIEPEFSAAPDTDDAPHDEAVDPRQGTLLGFERPVEAPATLPGEQATLEMEPAAPTPVVRAARGKSAAIEKSDAGAGLNLTGLASVVEVENAVEPELEGPVASEKATASEKAVSAKKAVSAEKAVAAEKTVASKKQAEPAQPAYAVAAAIPPAALASSSAPTAEESSRPLDGAISPPFAQIVASLQEALSQERSAAQERWRRTRHWLALASAGLVLLFAVSVAQTVALVGFAHRAQAAQQQTEFALRDQQAALAGLASSASALAVHLDSLPLTVTAIDTSVDAKGAQRLARHAKLAHARHAAKEQSKPAAR